MPCNDCSRAETCPPCVNEPEEPKGSESCQHPDPYCYAPSGSSEEWTRYYLCTACKAKWETVERRSVPEEPEPPMTPEEEEQAPEDEHRCNACGHHKGEGCGCPPHEFVSEGHCDRCAEAWRNQLAGIRMIPRSVPPQPDRRPPALVVYSVQGHLYEVAVSGDAAVRAVDGALVITHALGPVAGIVQVAPVPTKEGA